MEEKFGIVIEAVTNGFKAKMNEIKNLGQQMANEVKEAWTITPKIDTKNLSAMQLQTKGLMKQLHFPNVEPNINGLKIYTNQISTATGQTKLLANNLTLMKAPIKEAATEMKKFDVVQKQASANASVFSNTGKNINQLGNQIQNASKKMLRFGLSVLSIRSIFSLVSRASSAYLAQDTALADKLQSAWAGLGAFLAPLIDWIATKIIRLVSYMNIFIKAVTGQDLLAKAAKKATASIKDQTKATKGLNKALTDMDEITNIQMDENAGGAGGGAGFENPFDNFKDVDLPWADKIKKFGEWVKANWPLIALGIGGIALAITGLKLAMAGGAFATFGRILAGIGVTALGVAIAIYNVKQYFDDVKKGLENSEQGWKHFGGIIAGIGVAILGVGIIIGGVPVIIAGVIVTILGIMAAFWPKIKQGIENFGTWLLNFNQNLFGNTIGDIITAPFFDIKDTIIHIFEGLFKGVKDIVTGIMKFFQGDVKSGFRTIGKGLGNIVIGAVNSLISTVNLTLAPIRAIIVAIGKIAGKSITMKQISLPKIPYLDTGTNYVPEDQLAYIHKGEAVVPKKFNSAEYFSNINDNQETNALLLEVNKTLIEIREKDTTLNINGKELARTTYNDFRNEGNRLGQSSVVNVR